MRVPTEYNYVSAMLTLRCNLGCKYCINAAAELHRTRRELSGEQWVRGLNGLVLSPDLPITLEGGEPTLHKDFYSIITGIRHPVCMLTNLSFDVQEFIRNVDPRICLKFPNRAFKAIRVSYHADMMDKDDVIGRSIALQDAGFSVGIFGINYPVALPDNITMAEKCRKEHLYFYVKDYLGDYEGQMIGHYRYPEALGGGQKHCECRTNEVLIAPDGFIYRCHRDLYAGDGSVSDLMSSDEDVEYVFRHCDKMGLCNPCDVKMKTNRFLQAGNSSVEICPT